jgi:hypothetical protein
MAEMTTTGTRVETMPSGLSVPSGLSRGSFRRGTHPRARSKAPVLPRWSSCWRRCRITLQGPNWCFDGWFWRFGADHVRRWGCDVWERLPRGCAGCSSRSAGWWFVLKQACQITGRDDGKPHGRARQGLWLVHMNDGGRAKALAAAGETLVDQRDGTERAERGAYHIVGP